MVAHLFDDAHLVSDDDHGDTELSVNILDKLEYLTGGLGVECAGRLVAQQDLGVRCQRTGDRNTLLLTAGKLCRVRIGFVGQTDKLQKLTSLFLGIRLLYTRYLHREADVLKTGALHEQVKVLEYHRDITTGCTKLRRRHGVKVLTVDDDLAAGGALEQVDASDKC